MCYDPAFIVLCLKGNIVKHHVVSFRSLPVIEAKIWFFEGPSILTNCVTNTAPIYIPFFIRLVSMVSHVPGFDHPSILYVLCVATPGPLPIGIVGHSHILSFGGGWGHFEQFPSSATAQGTDDVIIYEELPTGADVKWFRL